jgi:hypothetical protein
MLHSYNEIYIALDFAHKFKATSVTIETDSGILEMSTEDAQNDFEDLAPGEAFSLLNISFAEVD